MSQCLAVVLAAGEGTRMQSSTPKVLHKIAGLEMVCHVLAACSQAGCDKIALVVGAQGAAIEKHAKDFYAPLEIFCQQQPLGTAHAALAARAALAAAQDDDVLIVCGDTPLLQPQSLRQMRDCLRQGADLVVGGFITDNPTGYGRLIVQQGHLTSAALISAMAG